MSKRIDKSWLVFASVENEAHDRCVDIFSRPDGTFGYEEFRRDVEDGGAWTPTDYFSGTSFATVEQVYTAAERSVRWLADVLRENPGLRRMPNGGRK
jgi:hypothetical protein